VMDPSALRTRRTQQERRAETRQRLLDATIRSLVDYGYPATTGRRVAELAGVSRGAQTHYYPQMADLIGDAVEHLADRRAGELQRRVADLRGSDRQVPALVDLLWDDYTSDLFRAVVKLWVAADDDPVLRKRLASTERHLRVVMRSLFDELAAELGVPEVVAPRLELVFDAVRGLALIEVFEPRGRRSRRDRWATIRPLLIDLLDAPE
jgi:DNA-binding transcriptional regulator YbjK